MSNTRYLMVSSAVMLALAGLAVSFAPAKFLGALGIDAPEPLPNPSRESGSDAAAFRNSG